MGTRVIKTPEAERDPELYNMFASKEPTWIFGDGTLYRKYSVSGYDVCETKEEMEMDIEELKSLPEKAKILFERTSQVGDSVAL